MYEPKNKRVTAEDLPNAEEIVVTYTATSSEKTLAPYDESEGGAQNIQTESSSALGALGATDSSDFSFATVDKSALATLASLPVMWAVMVIVSRQLGQDHVLDPAQIVFFTQMGTVPIFAGVWALGRDIPTRTDETAESFGPLVVQSGLILGGLWCLGGLIQTQGFASGASASHGAFLTQMTTIIVPLISFLRGDKIHPKFFLACALAVPGIACFAADSAGGEGTSTLTGDLFCVLAALCYASYDLVLVEIGDKVNAAELNVMRAAVGTVSAGLVYAATSGGFSEGLDSLAEFDLSAAAASAAGAVPSVTETVQAIVAKDLDLGSIVAAICSVPAIGLPILAVVNSVSAQVQPKAHAAVPAAVSQVFYAQTPLWASVMAFLLLHESFSALSLAGAGAFTLSLVVAASPDALLENGAGMMLAESEDDDLTPADGTANATAAVEGGLR